jgi:Tol biopolymer transport system component
MDDSGRGVATGEKFDVSADGCMIVTEADHSLIPGPDRNAALYLAEMSTGRRDIFVIDRGSGVITRVTNGDDSSYGVSITDDGRLISFMNNAGGIDSSPAPGVFTYDNLTQTLRRELTGSRLPSRGAQIATQLSADGRYLVFHGEGTWAPSALGQQIWRLDRTTGAVRLISTNTSGVAGNGTSVSVGISNDGNRIVFGSQATNLASGDTNGGVNDIFLWDNGTVSRITTGNASSQWPAISGDGSRIVFVSWATNLPGASDADPTPLNFDASNEYTSAPTGSPEAMQFETSYYNEGDVFTYTIGSGSIRRVTAGQTTSWIPTISDDGNRIAFASGDQDPIGGNGPTAVSGGFVYDHTSQSLTTILWDSQDRGYRRLLTWPTIADNGTSVVFHSSANHDGAPNDTDGATNDNFVWTR